MATSLWKFFHLNLNKKLQTNVITSIRNGHHLRGKPPTEARTIKQRLDELNRKDPTLTYRINIGLAATDYSKSKQMQRRSDVLKEHRKDANLERLARERKLDINLDDAYAEWLKTCGPTHIRDVADHYAVFQHLFGDAYFFPIVPLSIYFNANESDLSHPVYFGNVIKPVDAAHKPEVVYDVSDDPNGLWTLILTNPDGHFTEENSEYVHWFVGNIPGNKIENGETIVEYLQPFPPKGTGYHRHVFVLYKQEKKIDFSEFKKDGLCMNLSDRTFSTLNFYRNRQDHLTPASLAFFQSDWDPSLTDFYHNVLDMKEPVYEYDFPAPFIRPQKWFAKKQPFNLYMDKYRDPKQINKEFLVRKLKKVHPFKEPPPPVPYPLAQPFKKYVPSWLKLEIRKSRAKWGRVNDIE